MPDLAYTKPKKWGKVNKATLHNLINDMLVDINNLSTKSIDAIHAKNFRHREQRSFRRNFRIFPQGTPLRVSTAAQGGSKVSHCIDGQFFYTCYLTASPIPPPLINYDRR